MQKGSFISGFLSLLLLAVLPSCNTTKFLDVDEFLLRKNSLVLKPVEKMDNRRNLTYELTTLYQQQPNGRFFFIPREWFYFATSEARDTTRFDRWQRRVLGEEPAIFSEDLATASANAMRYYLEYRGYYDAQSFWDETVYGKKDKKVKVTYFVEPGHRYLIDSVFFSSPDSRIDSLLQLSKNASQLKRGEGLEGKQYELEKDRITQFLRNQGYAYFSSNYIQPLEVDTTVRPFHVQVYLTVAAPLTDSTHQQYRVGNVTVFPDFDPTVPDSLLRDTLINGIRFRTPGGELSVRPQEMLRGIHLYPKSFYSQEDYDLTNRQLGALGVFKFVRIKTEVNREQPQLLDIIIELSQAPRFEMGFDFELNYTNRSNAAGSGNLIGLSASPSMRHRNLFKGAELLIGNLSGGVEVNPDPKARFWNTIDLRAQGDLYFPHFRDYLGLWHLNDLLPIYRKRKAAGIAFYDQLQEYATTRLTTSYNYVLLLDFYRYTLANFSYGYELQRGGRRYLITQAAIDFLRPDFYQQGQALREANPFFANSFGNQLFLSLLFREFNYTYNSRKNRKGESSYFSLNAETAGAETYAINSLYNRIAGRKDTLQIGETDFSQYLRLESEFRYFRDYSPKRSIVARLNIGFSRPFGFSRNVPYVKQFYVGGPNSIRGWAARGLGPGGYIDSLTVNANNRLFFYQTGDLKLEFNLEYRFNIFWRLNGALFLDGGNVWTISRDGSRPGSQFRWSPDKSAEGTTPQGSYDPFYQQIALSPGLGFRLDLTYFVFRLDFGFPLRYPYRQENGQFWNTTDNWRLRDLNLNFGLGLPF
ncbi:MAG: BamA/TamA family outer membrane protein [Lewinellaceae bacterium]|nr:BamA/TamA family outer membrane protein [Lewinellaceae bacterium]